VKPSWLGPEPFAEEPQSFGSWVADGRELTVFYPLNINGDRPGQCRAHEQPDCMMVTVTVRAPIGAVTAAAGFNQCTQQSNCRSR
jgi:hypothetical protein